MLQIVRWLGLPFLLIAFLPTIAWSGDEDLLLAEIPTVYAATRHEQPVTEAPAAVTVITRDDIVKYAERCSRRGCMTLSSISASAG